MAAGRRVGWRCARARAPRPNAAAREARPPGRPMQLTPPDTLRHGRCDSGSSDGAPPEIQQHAPVRHQAATLRVRLVGRNERRAAAASRDGSANLDFRAWRWRWRSRRRWRRRRRPTGWCAAKTPRPDASTTRPSSNVFFRLLLAVKRVFGTCWCPAGGDAILKSHFQLQIR